MGPGVRCRAPAAAARRGRADPPSLRRGLRAAHRGDVLSADGGIGFATSVDLAHPPEKLFRYLVDPRNRPEWQASLLSVTLADRGEPRVGTTWRDNTMAGVRPRMEITALEPYRLFGEAGTWRGIRADLEMRFTAIGSGCRVDVSGEIRGTGVWRAPARAAARLAGRAIRHDLVRAGDALTRRPR